MIIDNTQNQGAGAVKQVPDQKPHFWFHVQVVSDSVYPASVWLSTKYSLKLITLKVKYQVSLHLLLKLAESNGKQGITSAMKRIEDLEVTNYQRERESANMQST